jgi:hypothetical protein
MPHRQFSAMTVGGLWPMTDPQSCQAASEVQHSEGVKRLQAADSTRDVANHVAADQSGQFVDGFCKWCTESAEVYKAWPGRSRGVSPLDLGQTTQRCDRAGPHRVAPGADAGQRTSVRGRTALTWWRATYSVDA